MHLFDLSFKWLIPKEKISKRSSFKDQEWIRGCFLRSFQEEKGTMVLHLLNWLTTSKLYLSTGLKTLGVPNVTSFCNRFNITWFIFREPKAHRAWIPLHICSVTQKNKYNQIVFMAKTTQCKCIGSVCFSVLDKFFVGQENSKTQFYGTHFYTSLYYCT